MTVIKSSTVIKIKQPAIRVITQSAFLERLNRVERIAIRNLSKTDDNVLDILEGLKSSPRVRLDLKQTIDGLKYLTTIGVLDKSRIPELLIDGEEDERY